MSLRAKFQTLFKRTDERVGRVNARKKSNNTAITAGALLLTGTVICCVFLPKQAEEQASAELKDNTVVAGDSDQRENFDIIKKEYNEGIRTYNEQAGRVNSLIGKLQEIEIPNLPDYVSEKAELVVNLDEFLIENSSLSELEGLVCNNDVEVERLKLLYEVVCVDAYNYLVADYNLVASSYNEIIKTASIEFITNMPEKIEIMADIADSSEIGDNDIDSVIIAMEELKTKINTALANYLVVFQISNPSEGWILERLQMVNSVVDAQAVSPQNDPNGLLGVEGGYTACVYFTIKDIDVREVDGDDIVGKGTDAGGAIEVYTSRSTALARCDYLSQFDGTLLYTGSYTIIGTMVVRTSYKLTTDRQIELTNEITEALTCLK